MGCKPSSLLKFRRHDRNESGDDNGHDLMNGKVGKMSAMPKHRPSQLETEGEEVLSVWIRDGIDVTDKYDFHQVVGHGHLGEISIVTRKMKKGSNSDSEGKSVDTAATGPSGQSSSDLRTLDSMESAGTGIVSHRLYACKTVSTTRMRPLQMEELLNEVTIMRNLDHPHILRLFEVYYVKRKMWLITELCTGGDLFARIDTNTELDICRVMEQIFRAVTYLHRQGVCHRDIKLENILYEHVGPEAGIKLIDFGLSQKFTQGNKMLRACGTMYSAAPELLVAVPSYTEMADIWSVGIVAFILLSGGTYPFLKETIDAQDEALMDRLQHAHYTCGDEWKERGISKIARDFVYRCLRRHPGIRWKAVEGLEFIRNEWMPALEAQGAPSHREPNMDSSHEHKLDEQALRGLKEFGLYGQLKKRILMTMAYTMDKSSMSELKDMFISFDTEGNGTISLKEMQQAVKQFQAEKGSESNLTDEDIAEMFKGINQDRSGQIHYAEFLAAAMESHGLVTMERLGEAFDRIDTEGKGYISKDDLRNILGGGCNEELVNRTIEEVDYKKSGQVDYDEFLRLMFDRPTNTLEVRNNESPVAST